MLKLQFASGSVDWHNRPNGKSTAIDVGLVRLLERFFKSHRFDAYAKPDDSVVVWVVRLLNKS